MDYVIKKTYLGLALEEVLEELGIEHMNKEIFQSFRESFQNNYKGLMKDASPIKIEGV